tara:strand:+ start:453 stop:1814 length:1362 start_codon:yes stop_codon:yes gene_type:complete
MGIGGKNLDSRNLAVVPSAYRIKSIIITNYRGEKADVLDISTRMVINESLYSNTLTLKLTLKDSTNFIEDFPIIGQEKIKIKFDYKRLSSGENGEDNIDIEIDFFVNEYPTFGSSENQAYTQAISLLAISEQSYISNQKKISRSYNNNTSKEILKIFYEELNLIKSKFKTSPEGHKGISTSRGIISNQKPLDVIEWFRRQTYSENTFSPFFLYQTVDGSFNFKSMSYLVSKDNKVYNTYYDVRGFNYSSLEQAESNFRQSDQRILSVSSDLKLNKSIQSRRGAFASKNNYLDYGNKTYTNFEYNYQKDFLDKGLPSLEGKKILSDQFLIGDQKLTDFTQAHCEYISVNSKAFDGNSNYNNMSKISRHFLNAYNALSDTITHDIRLHGNLRLTAGTKIELIFPKNIDPLVRKEQDHKNKFLSGKYLITSAIHEFSDDEYYVNLRVKRDSFSVDL